ncbi:ABC transporter ATP-binding protein [Rhodospirillum rubrum]|uniref:ABC transporter ATP-binding protein n=1 Tax=Rhodospirillum rubrum TaxID=1085 RepID=UPI00190426BD|nr:ABC transporter ATP-binding protein [Rhodospirillum rubrum]MBK1663481.1 ABC transporter ATP-binding protein [Rhodospirillum rubrum]MBK1675679.1 ABC transporter ATP-binding protein [Rhodospirillum rubrum]
MPASPFPAVLLETAGLCKNFRGLKALRDHALRVAPGEILGVIGPNGSGKSTLFNVITGFSPPSAGRVCLNGIEVTGWRPDAIVRQGIARTFQGSRLFKALTAAENIEAAAQLALRPGLFSTLLRPPGYRRRTDEIVAIGQQMLDLVGLGKWGDRRAGDLPYGAQRRLEIARAMATKPKLLMLDEPAAGLNTHETAELMTLIRQLRELYGVAVIIVEHDMDLIGTLCERIQVLAQGTVIGEGSFAAIQDNIHVREAYLGHD